MTGTTLSFKTDGTGRDQPLSIIFPTLDPDPSYALTVISAAGNSTANFVAVGRQAPAIQLYAKDSFTFYSAGPSEIVFNDQGNAQTIWVDISGPMQPAAQRVTAYQPRMP